MVQINTLPHLKTFGSSITYTVSNCEAVLRASILVFWDARRNADLASVLAELLLDYVQKDTVFHFLSWIIPKSRSPVKFVGAAEVLAAGEINGEVKMLRLALSTFAPIDINFTVVIDSRDLLNFFSICTNSDDRSIRTNVSDISY